MITSQSIIMSALFVNSVTQWRLYCFTLHAIIYCAAIVPHSESLQSNVVHRKNDIGLNAVDFQTNWFTIFIWALSEFWLICFLCDKCILCNSKFKACCHLGLVIWYRYDAYFYSYILLNIFYANEMFEAVFWNALYQF